MSPLRRAFLSSPHHAAMALATVGTGFATGEPLYFILGTTAYVLGWVYVPDLPFFRRWLEKKRGTVEAAAAEMELADFAGRRDALINGLTPGRRERYRELAVVCEQIESAAAEGAGDLRVRKIEELMWTYLRLLSIEQSLAQFVETERREDVPGLLAMAEEEAARLATGLDVERQQGGPRVDALEKLLTSRRELVDTLKKRHARLAEAGSNLALVVSEQERLEQQIKLIRADLIASRNATGLSARIDATVEHLEQTNQWLRDMDQFKDLAADLPQSGAARLGFGELPEPPPLPQRAPARGKERA